MIPITLKQKFYLRKIVGNQYSYDVRHENKEAHSYPSQKNFLTD